MAQLRRELGRWDLTALGINQVIGGAVFAMPATLAAAVGGWSPILIAVIQRFGGALNLNLHIHALVLDGVFAKEGSGVVRFHRGSRLTALDIDEVLATVEPRITRLLDRRGLGEGDDEGSVPDRWADDAPVLAGLAAASVRGDRGARSASRRAPSSSGGRVGVRRGARARFEALTIKNTAPRYLYAFTHGRSLFRVPLQ